MHQTIVLQYICSCSYPMFYFNYIFPCECLYDGNTVSEAWIYAGVSSDSKSGQTFWRSSDGTLVVKTIKGYECRTMRKILATYANHVTGNLSCLSGVLGLYRVRMRGKRTYFLVTRCVFSKVATPATVSHRYYSGSSSTNDGFVDRNNNEGSGLRYDLKGSTYGRQKSSSSSVLKDLDLIYSSTGHLHLLQYLF